MPLLHAHDLDVMVLPQAVPGGVCDAFLAELVLAEEPGAGSGTFRRVLHEDHWLGELLFEAATRTNGPGGWSYDLLGVDGMHVVDHAGRGPMSWQDDRGGDEVRCAKLTVLLQLDPPVACEGGELELATGHPGVRQVDEVRRGSLVMFPSFVPYRFRSVRRGRRRVAVAIIGGPVFR